MLASRFICFLIVINAFHTAYGKQAEQQPATIAEYDKLVSRYRYYKPDSATLFAQKGIALAKKQKDDNGIAMMYNQLGMIDDNKGKYELSRQKYLYARSIYQRTGFQKGIAAENIRLGVVEMRKGNYDKAIGYFLEALKVSEKSGNKPGQMEAYMTLGEGHMGRKNYISAIKYLQTAKKIDDSIAFSNLSLNLLNDFGMFYRETGDYDQAIANFQEGIARSNLPQYQGLYITLTNNLATVYAKLGYRDRSIALQKTALAKSREIKNYLRELQTLTGLASTYGKQDPAQALSYLEQAYQLAKSNDAHKQELEALNSMAVLYKYQGNYRAALDVKELEYAIADSFFYADMSKQVASLQAEYELSRSKAKIQELKLINSKEQLKTKVTMGIIAGILLLFVIMAYFYNRTRKLNSLLNKANKGLEESNTVKDKLFSVLAHDLRSPLASIINLLYLVDDDGLSANERRDMLNKLSVICNASLETLDSLLKWGEMQFKGIRLKQEKLQPGDAIRRNITLLSGSAEEKHISIYHQVPDDIFVKADPDHFDFVVRNLLSNAIKFTPEKGKVSISASTDPTGNNITFIVKDTGVGIPKERLEYIFDISNVSTNGTNNEKGTSLGLVICKEFVEANKGTIAAKSEVGKGSEFMFSLQKAGN